MRVFYYANAAPDKNSLGSGATVFTESRGETQEGRDLVGMWATRRPNIIDKVHSSDFRKFKSLKFCSPVLCFWYIHKKIENRTRDACHLHASSPGHPPSCPFQPAKGSFVETDSRTWCLLWPQISIHRRNKGRSRPDNWRKLYRCLTSTHTALRLWRCLWPWRVWMTSDVRQLPTWLPFPT